MKEYKVVLSVQEMNNAGRAVRVVELEKTVSLPEMPQKGDCILIGKRSVVVFGRSFEESQPEGMILLNPKQHSDRNRKFDSVVAEIVTEGWTKQDKIPDGLVPYCPRLSS